MVVGRRLSYWEDKFSEATLNFGFGEMIQFDEHIFEMG